MSESLRLDHRICDTNLAIYRERALRAEALVRAKDETIGELLDVIDSEHKYLSYYPEGVQEALDYWREMFVKAKRGQA